jgi:hypothetical protein
VLVALVRFLVVLFLVRLGFRMLAATRERSASSGGRAQELVRDRVCNTFLPRDRALLGVIDGHTEPFCSAECRDRALGLVRPVPS